MNHTFHCQHTATTGAALRIVDPSTGLVFDFAADTWAALGSATTPYVALTEPSSANLGTGQSLYQVTIDLARLHRGLTPRQLLAVCVSTTTPATTATPLDVQSFSVQAGAFGEAVLSAPATCTVRTLDGFAVQLSARVSRAGRLVDPLTCGRAQFTANAGTDVITSAAHGLSNGQVLVIHTLTGVLPTGLSAGTAYYVRDVTTDTFKLAATSGGTAIDITTAGTTPNYWDRPLCVVTVRELGSGVAAFTRTLDASHVRNGRFEGESPEGAQFTANAGTDVITSAAHGLANTAPIVVSVSPGGTLPAGLVDGTVYYVRDVTTDTFKLAATSGGAAIDITTAGTGAFLWVPAVPQLMADRQYECAVTLTLAGQTYSDSTPFNVLG